MNRVDYNTERQSMVMAEYGRVVQDMVKYCISIQDREERQQCAQAIVAVMANISQEKLTNIDVQQKMWNHLAVISDFQLDIDYPVEIIKKEEVEEQPAPMALPQSKIVRVSMVVSWNRPWIRLQRCQTVRNVMP